MGDDSRDDVYDAADELHWVIEDKPNKNGYFKVRCPCGKHLLWLHKTPSDPNYYKHKIQYMRQLACAAPVG